MKAGDSARFSIKDGRWLDCRGEITSANGRSLGVGVEEDVPLPCGIIDGRQWLFLLDGVEIQGGRRVEIRAS